MMDANYSSLDPKVRKLIEDVQSRSPANQQLVELKKQSEALNALSTYWQTQVKKAEQTNGDVNEVLLDVRDALDAFVAKDDPEYPDTSKAVVEAVNGLKSELSKAINSIDVKPQVNVSSPDVIVPEPNVDVKVDLKGVEKAFQAAIESIPQPEVKDDSGFQQQMLEALASIDTGTRLKPQMPTNLKVTNTDGSDISLGGYRVAREDSTSDPSYFGFEDRSSNWYVLRITDSTGLYEYSAGSGGISTNWAGRSGLTYGDYGAIL